MEREEEGVHLPLEGRGGVFWEWLVGTGVRKNVNCVQNCFVRS